MARTPNAKDISNLSSLFARLAQAGQPKVVIGGDLSVTVDGVKLQTEPPVSGTSATQFR